LHNYIQSLPHNTRDTVAAVANELKKKGSSHIALVSTLRINPEKYLNPPWDGAVMEVNGTPLDMPLLGTSSSSVSASEVAQTLSGFEEKPSGVTNTDSKSPLPAFKFLDKAKERVCTLCFHFRFPTQSIHGLWHVHGFLFF
jgi:hypothetical protein